jgi:hypothetical protein
VWSVKSERCAHALLGRHRVAWREHIDAPIQVAASSGIDDGLSRLQQWHQVSKVRSLQIWLDGSLCALRVAPAIRGVRNVDEAEAALHAHFVSSEGLTPESTVRIALWASAAADWLCVLVFEGVVDQLVAKFGKSVRSVRPWWSSAMPLRGGHTVAFDGQSLSYCEVAASGAISDAGTVFPIDGEAAARRWLQRRSQAHESPQRAVVFLDWGRDRHSNSLPTGAMGKNQLRTVEFGFTEWVRYA